MFDNILLAPLSRGWTGIQRSGGGEKSRRRSHSNAATHHSKRRIFNKVSSSGERRLVDSVTHSRGDRMRSQPDLGGGIG